MVSGSLLFIGYGRVVGIPEIPVEITFIPYDQKKIYLELFRRFRGLSEILDAFSFCN